MEFSNHLLGMMVAIVAAIYAALMQGARADLQAPAPAPTSDCTTIDQGIAYILMLLALVVTYIMH